MKQKALLQIIGAGWVAGMRSMGALALVSTYLSNSYICRLLPEPARSLCKGRTADAFRMMALGEMVADKMPFVPNRTELPSLVGRTVSGALAGAALSAAQRERREFGALIGGLVAALSTFVMFHVRTGIARETGLPDLPVALAEDAVILGAYYNVQK